MKEYLILVSFISMEKEVCGRCSVSGSDMRSCSACKSVKYCSKLCQKNDWSNHRPICDDVCETYSKKITTEIDKLTACKKVMTVLFSLGNILVKGKIQCLKYKFLKLNDKYCGMLVTSTIKEDVLLKDKINILLHYTIPETGTFTSVFTSDPVHALACSNILEKKFNGINFEECIISIYIDVNKNECVVLLNENDKKKSKVITI